MNGDEEAGKYPATSALFDRYANALFAMQDLCEAQIEPIVLESADKARGDITITCMEDVRALPLGTVLALGGCEYMQVSVPSESRTHWISWESQRHPHWEMFEELCEARALGLSTSLAHYGG